ncbi:MAG: hypothetical protein ACP5LM_02510 [Thermoplasmata archaeon]
MEGNLLKVDPRHYKLIKSLNIKTTKSGKYVNDPYNVLYMFEKNELKILDKNNESIGIKDLIKILNIDVIKYNVFRYFKRRGFEIEENDHLVIKKNDFKSDVYIKRPYENVKLNFSGILALVDDYLETTFYSFENIDLKGENFNIEEKDNLFGDKPNILDRDMKIVHDFLIRNGISLKSGMKFGCEFLGYVRQEDEHSKYMIKIVREGMTYIESAGLARVAHATKKSLILIKVKNDKIENYKTMEWIKI